MPTYLVNWNPKRWHWERHGEFVAKTKAGQMPVFDWSTGNRKNIEVGDRLFLVRQSTDRGLIGSGFAVRGSHEAPHWDETRDDSANVVDIRWDALLNTADVLPVAELEAANLGVPWDNLLGSGVKVPDESAARLEQLWEDHLRSIGRLGGEFSQAPMVFLRTGWMIHYRGWSKDDPISGGFKYVKETGSGHEMFNFEPFNGRVYGYCRNTQGGNAEFVHGAGIKLERLGAGKRDARLDGVLVVWLAPPPNQKGNCIVGWYRNATVYRKWQEPPPGSNRTFNGEDFGYFASANADDAVLLEPDARTFVLSKGPGVIGQASVWYADDPATSDLRQQVLRYIAGYGLPVYPDELDESKTYSEGTKRQVIINAYERDSRARAACIKIYGAKCVVCGFDFESQYGAAGKGLIHVHHLIPLSQVGPNYRVNPKTDLRPVCPNCHVIIHPSWNRTLTIEEAKRLVRHRFAW